MPQAMYSHAFFDVDGTLCDPGDSIARAAQHGLASVGITESDLGALRRFVGPPLEHSFRDYYGLSPRQIDSAVTEYRAHKAQFGMDDYVAYTGVTTLLETLQHRGVQLNIVTSKLHSFALHALRSTNLLHFFDGVYACPADKLVTKDLILAEALVETQAPVSRSVMIGDRSFDIEAASINGIDSIGVLYGYGTLDELLGTGATHLAMDTASIEQLLPPYVVHVR